MSAGGEVRERDRKEWEWRKPGRDYLCRTDTLDMVAEMLRRDININSVIKYTIERAYNDGWYAALHTLPVEPKEKPE
jgi:hypothetical protein